MTRGRVIRDTVDVAFVRALERDRHREAVDGAKRRAALQRCDYNSFHQLVLGADLRPIHPRDSVSDARSDGTRINQHNRGRVPIDEVPLSSSRSVNVCLTASRSADEFIRVWRRGCGDDDARKTELLFSVTADEFECAFKVELGLDLLRDFVRLIHAQVARDPPSIDRAVDILCALTRCGRFGAHARLAGEKTSALARATLNLAVETPAIRDALRAWSTS